MSEAGLAGVSVPTWQAIFAPPKTHSGIINRLAQQTKLAIDDADVRQQFDKLLLQPEASTPERLSSLVAKDVDTWRVFIRENNIPLE
jgi:tripartite-type tricarboxylate transporter receptor subunit TctC